MRYVAVPVIIRKEYGQHQAELDCLCGGTDHEKQDGWGYTEDEAFADLLAKLGYREVKGE